MRVPALALVVAAVASAGCSGTEEVSPSATTTTRSPSGLPSGVAATHSKLLAAAEAGEYELLRPVLDRAVFLSDFGFGNDQPDPIDRWKALGPKPLDTMGAILRMPHAVKETNEGTLYQWPRLDPDSNAGDVTPAEREAFLTFMTDGELANAFRPEYGYTGPRLGILADGTWWFFLSAGAP